jgi:hypothetical protein
MNLSLIEKCAASSVSSGFQILGEISVLHTHFGHSARATALALFHVTLWSGGGSCIHEDVLLHERLMHGSQT